MSFEYLWLALLSFCLYLSQTQGNLDLTPRYAGKCAAYIYPNIPITKGNKRSQPS